MLRHKWISYAALCTMFALTGCGRPIPNDPAPNVEASSKIRATLVSTSKAPGAAVESEAAPQASGFGTIKGRFVYEGQAPAPAAISITKDIEVCGQHHLTDESLLVDSKGGLANAVIFARNKNLKSDKPAEGEVVLDNNGCHFQPHIAVVQAGQTLIVKNSDPVAHNTNASLAANPAFNDTVPVGGQLTKKITLGEQSPAPVVCTIHPWMKGYVVVQPHPFVAVSAKDGTFEIKNVPAGIPLEFQAWHESSANRTGALVADRPDLKWQNNGRFTVTLKPDEVLDLSDIKVPATALAAK